MSSTFSAEKLMQTDRDKLVCEYESSHQVRQPTAKYPVTTDYIVFQNSWEVLLAITGHDTTVQHGFWKHLASFLMSFINEMFYIK